MSDKDLLTREEKINAINEIVNALRSCGEDPEEADCNNCKDHAECHLWMRHCLADLYEKFYILEFDKRNSDEKLTEIGQEAIKMMKKEKGLNSDTKSLYS